MTLIILALKSFLLSFVFCGLLCKFWYLLPAIKQKWFVAHVNYPATRPFVNDYVKWMLDLILVFDKKKAAQWQGLLTRDFTLIEALYYPVPHTSDKFEQPASFDEAQFLLEESKAYNCTDSLAAVLTTQTVDTSEIFSSGFLSLKYWKKISSTQVVLQRKIMCYPSSQSQVLPFTPTHARRPFMEATVDDEDITLEMNKHDTNDNVYLAAALQCPNGEEFNFEYL